MEKQPTQAQRLRVLDLLMREKKHTLASLVMSLMTNEEILEYFNENNL